LLSELSLGRKLVARPKVTLLQETLDLLDDPLIEAAATDRLDDGQVRTSQLFRSGGLTRAERG